ncbi:MAG TPA: hypothetical protein DCZ94_22580 [Lentisphaeria bacterium]|nr:MAG: hypothetical protein A2X48_13825 [Lentisphaerae bacterium GWF2_49_21]HBC89735.1 hypothetical protein [Lentisphaeria bacterium]
MIKSLMKSRIVELLFGTGIPLVGFACATKGIENLADLYWFYAFLLLTGWHVLAVNDICFDRKSFRFSIKYFPPLVMAPAILLYFSTQKPVFVLILFLIIINWNIYSVYGKYNWLTGMFHNFSGGVLHFLAGVAAAGCTDMYQYSAQALFFGFAMLSGAMHHDACHSSEDMERDYRTGAVVFGKRIWWRLGIMPMIAGIVFLLCTKDMPFMFCFCFSSSLYLIMYSAVNTWKLNNGMLYFRILCRLAFATGAVAYIALRLLK